MLIMGVYLTEKQFFDEIRNENVKKTSVNHKRDLFSKLDTIWLIIHLNAFKILKKRANKKIIFIFSLDNS